MDLMHCLYLWRQLPFVDLSVHMSAGPLLVAEHVDGANVWPVGDWDNRDGVLGKFGTHHFAGKRLGHFTTPPVEVPT